MVVGDCGISKYGWTDLGQYNEDLTVPDRNSDKSLDIVKVYEGVWRLDDINKNKIMLLWERTKEDPMEKKEYHFESDDVKCSINIVPNNRNGYYYNKEFPITITYKNNNYIYSMSIPTAKEVIAALTEIVEYIERQETKKGENK